MRSLAFFFLSGSYWWYFLVVSFPSSPVLVFWMQHPPSLTEGTNFSISAGYIVAAILSIPSLQRGLNWAAILVCLFAVSAFHKGGPSFSAYYNTSLLFRNLRD